MMEPLPSPPELCSLTQSSTISFHFLQIKDKDRQIHNQIIGRQLCLVDPMEQSADSSPNEQLHQLPDLAGWVLTQAIHMAADIRVLQRQNRKIFTPLSCAA
jgi:hypothetical protein